MSTIKERYAPQIDFNPYLTYPIKDQFRITEGFLYTKQERDIHGNYFHKGIDFACPYGTPVYAAASGYAVASYVRFTNFNRKDKSPRLYKGLPLGNGPGYFIQIYHPKKVCDIKGGRITQYGHLSRFADGIYAKTFRAQDRDWRERLTRKNKSLKKNRLDDDALNILIQDTRKLCRRFPWVKRQYGFKFEKDINKKESYFWSPTELKKLHKEGSKFVKWVEQGDLIGFVGTSGIVHGRLKFRENLRRPRVREYRIWDECHLHFIEGNRDWKTGRKIEDRDPYDLYLSKEHYKGRFRKSLFKEEKQGRLW